MKSTWVVTLFLASWALVSAYGRAASGTDAEVQSVADIGAELIAGNYEKAAADAQKFLRTAEDEDAATEARRILAVSLRKQGKWREAAGAYQALSRQFPKGSDDRLRYAATSDVLLASPKGVYKGTDEKQKLSDDAALKAALAKWATFRCTRLSSYCQRLGRARSPQDVVRIILPAAEEARGIFLVGPDTPPDEAHRVAKTAGQKLELIKKRVCAVLEQKLQKYQPKMKRPWSFTNVEKKDIKKTNELCLQMADTEVAFRETLAAFVGGSEWSEAAALRSESSARQNDYRQLAAEYVVPEYETIEWDSW